MVYVVPQPYATGGNQIVSRFLWVVTGGPGYKTPTDVKEAGATTTVIISTKKSWNKKHMSMVNNHAL
jgi:hypothetical protein